MIDWIWSSFWLKAFVAHWVVMILVYEFVVLKKVRPITHGDPELHNKYPAFRRNDAHLFTNRLYNYLFVWTFTPRFLMTCLGLLMLQVGCLVISIGMPSDPNYHI